MTEKDFLSSINTSKKDGFAADFSNRLLERGKVSYRSPSNIALVKYWGKKENQIPANPSISFTLDVCVTDTTVSYQKKSDNYHNIPTFDLFFDGKPKIDFKPKIENFFRRIEQYLPFLNQYHLTIETSNSFPHSSGIASSASGMSALALCLMEIERELYPKMTDDLFDRKASFLARLGSGSACRSIEGELVQWGHHADIYGSSDLYGIKYPYKIHSVFKSFQDTILLVDEGKKQVSSTVGHNLMKGHAFAEQRFEQAHENLKQLISVFESGDLSRFIEIVESEALTLHAMMMASRPNFVLMKPNTLDIIQRIRDFREFSKANLCFTLDAGANVHVLYPKNEKGKVLDFIQNELLAFCQDRKHIRDCTGSGAKRL